MINEAAADTALRIGTSLIDSDPALAMDYFQRAIAADLDAVRIRAIGEVFEEWMGRPPGPLPTRLPNGALLNRVAHVVGCLQPGNGVTQYLNLLVASLKKQGIESTIFTTEWAASWSSNPAGVPLSEPLEIDAEVRIASVEGDFLARSCRIAEELRASKIAVAFFHANLAEQITACVASMRPVPVQVNVNHGTEMDADLFDGRIHLFEEGLRHSRYRCPAEWIPPALGTQPQVWGEQVSRQVMGLEYAASISATFGNLDSIGTGAYLRMLTEILQRFPQHVHLFAGVGSVRPIRSYLHGEGVLPQVRFLGNVKDFAPLMSLIDIYLSPSSEIVIPDAMSAGKPVAGCKDLDLACRLLRDSEFRSRRSAAALEEFETSFHPDRLGERYIQFARKLLSSPAASAAV